MEQPLMIVERTGLFKKDLKRVKAQGNPIDPLLSAIAMISNGVPLPPSMRDHGLNGKYIGYRECHIAPDWLLIYKLTKTTLTLCRTGSHAELF